MDMLFLEEWSFGRVFTRRNILFMRENVCFFNTLLTYITTLREWKKREEKEGKTLDITIRNFQNFKLLYGINKEAKIIMREEMWLVEKQVCVFVLAEAWSWGCCGVRRYLWADVMDFLWDMTSAGMV